MNRDQARRLDAINSMMSRVNGHAVATKPAADMTDAEAVDAVEGAFRAYPLDQRLAGARGNRDVGRLGSIKHLGGVDHHLIETRVAGDAADRQHLQVLAHASIVSDLVRSVDSRGPSKRSGAASRGRETMATCVGW